MNDILKDYARKWLRENLGLRLSVANRNTFKRMYSSKGIKADLNDVIKEMNDDMLDRAMTQVKRTIDKRETGK